MNSETKRMLYMFEDYIVKTKIFLNQIMQSSQEINLAAEIAEKRLEIIRATTSDLITRGFNVQEYADSKDVTPFNDVQINGIESDVQH